MIVKPIVKPIVLSLAVILTLAACDSPEERAEGHYQEGLALIEQGDLARAIVELRNVFRLNDNHLEARYALAGIYRDNGVELRRARAQYLRIVEQNPQELEARVSLAELSFQLGNFEELDRHASAADEIAPDNPRVQAVNIARLYRDAALAEDASERRAQAALAEQLLQDRPDDTMLRNLVVDNHIRDSELGAALGQLDILIEQAPDVIRYWQQRITILAQLEDFDALEEQLQQMVKQFDTTETKATLIRFYLGRGQNDQAEEFLRSEAEASDEIGPQIDLITFLGRLRGEEAARTELEAALSRQPDSLQLQVYKASLDFEAGRREEAIQLLETALESMGTSTEEEDRETFEMRHNIRMVLARMLLGTNNEVGARAQVEQVLAQDGNNPEALKLQSVWLIEADDTDEAIASLRIALENAPEDAETMTLMARAYERAGSIELAREFMALAVEASGNAPEETVRYAAVLIGDDQFLPAEDILLPALRLAPQNISLLRALGEVYLGTEDDARFQQVIDALKALNSPQADQIAISLEAEQINLQNGPEQAISFLEGIVDGSEADLMAKVTLVRARLATGDTAGALALTQEMLSADPENANLRAMNASVEIASGNLDTGEQIYRDLLQENPNLSTLWLELARVKNLQGQQDAAQNVIDEGITANPENPNLLWAKASALERQGDFEGAIDIYSDLYERNSGSVVVANNLASMLSTYRSDAESLDQAWTIARRLREANVPAFQDTYGWITHRRGDSAEALPYMEAAAEGLPSDPIVQFHLAEVYSALERSEDALRQYRISIEVAGPLDERPQIDRARERISEIEAALEQPTSTE